MPVCAGYGAAPGRAGGYEEFAVVVAGVFAGADRLVVSDGCDVDGVTPVGLAALVFMGEAVKSGMPAMIAARVSTLVVCAVFYEVGWVRGWRKKRDGRWNFRECEGASVFGRKAWNVTAVTTLGFGTWNRTRLRVCLTTRSARSLAAR
jgi:hypothetical protein